MPQLIESPSVVEAAGTKPKVIEEYVGQVTTGEARLSVARMRSPEGWLEPGQRPEFDEWTLVLDGTLHVEHDDGGFDVAAGQAVPGGAHYVAVCLPAFSPATVNRDDA